MICPPCLIAQDLSNYVSTTARFKSPAARIQSWIHDAVALHNECMEEGCTCKVNHDELKVEGWRKYFDKGTK